MRYLSAETACGRLWVAYREDQICFSLLGVNEQQFVAACQRRLGEAPSPAEDPALAERICARIDLDAALNFDLASWTPFQCDVLKAVAAIPRGQVRTYAEVAAAVGRPRAARAVGEVMRTNPIPVLIPCHRVVRSGGAIGNYSPHPDLKRRFLVDEGAISE